MPKLFLRYKDRIRTFSNIKDFKNSLQISLTQNVLHINKKTWNLGTRRLNQSKTTIAAAHLESNQLIGSGKQKVPEATSLIGKNWPNQLLKAIDMWETILIWKELVLLT